jgi:hypothetical protein
MTRKTLAIPIGVFLLTAARALPAQTAGVARIQVGPNVLVSRDDESLEHQEVQLGASPTDAKRLVACSMVDVGALSQRKMHTASYVSNDGGKSWTIGPTIPESGDPVCGFGPDGAVYFGAIGDSPSLDPAIDWHFKLFRSDDAGKPWEQKCDIVTGDRPWLAFDATQGPNRGWLYLTYQSRAGVLDSAEKQATVSLDLTHSSDRGATWSLPKAYGVVNAQRLSHSLPTMMATLSDGTVVISNWQNLKKRAIADEDGPAAPYPGMTGPPTCEISVVLVDPDGWKRPKTRKAADKYCAESPTNRTVDALAVDGRSEVFKDRIYLAWTDIRSGHARILFTSSSDHGETWRKPRAVDDAPPGLGHVPDSFMVTLAVNKDGVVGLTWNDRRENSDNIGYVTRFTASLDGGDTWLPSVRVSEQPAQFRPGGEGIAGYVAPGGGEGPLTLQVARVGFAGAGDTAGLAADADGVFHALWIDNRSGRGEVYTAPVTVPGALSKNGSPALAALVDVSGKVAVDLKDLSWDAKSQTATAEVTLRNTSKETIRGRLVVRVLSVSSEAGVVTVANADNGVAGAGATFDLTSLVPEGGLKPDASTASKTIRFQLKDVRPIRIDSGDVWKAMRAPLLDADLLILGEAPPAPAAEKK